MKISTLSRPLVLSLLAAIVTFSSPSCENSKNKETPQSLVITAIPDEKVSDQEAKFSALVSYLEENLSVPVSFSISADYSAAVQRFVNGEVHLVWFGGLTGVQARNQVPGARAIAQGDVDPQYKSYFIAHRSTGLQPSKTFPKDISKLTFTFGSPSSTSGRLMPTFFIEKETGKGIEDFFEKPVQFQTKGGHDATARAVASGAVQCGALSYKKYDSMVKDGEISPEEALIIWQTPHYADYNLTVHPDLEKFREGFIDELQEVLISCKDSEVLKAFNRDALISAKNEDFVGIQEVAQRLGFLR